jgi:hypothetical protein
VSRVVAGVDQAGSPAGGSERRGGGRYEWGVLASLGGAFAVVSLLDVGLAFVPLGFGTPGWEFSTATAVMNNLPLAVVGIGLLAVAGIGRGTQALVSLAGLLAGAVAVLVLLLAVLFVKNLGAATAAVTEPLLKQGLTESIVRTAVQLVAYLAALVWLVIRTRKAGG